MEEQSSPPPSSTTVAIAASGKENSKLALRWALENLISDGRKIVFKILHVRPITTTIMTPMRPLPISTVRYELASAHIAEIEKRTNEILAPYQRMCAQRKVEADTLVIEADDVVVALSAEVAKSGITQLILGSSSRNALSRRFLETVASTMALGWDPHFCAVYFVSRGKLSSVRTACVDINKVSEVANSRTSFSISSLFNYASATLTGWSNAWSSTPQKHSVSNVCPTSLVDQRYAALLAINQYNNSGISSVLDMPGGHNEDEFVSAVSDHSEKQRVNVTVDGRISQTETCSCVSDKTSTSNAQTNSAFPSNQISDELEKLRLQLRHVQEMSKMVQDEPSDTSLKVAEVSGLKMISTREEKVRELTRHGKGNQEAVGKENEFTKECREREFLQWKAAETESAAEHEVKEKHKQENMYMYIDHQFEKFDWEEIVSATSQFSSSLQVGEGAFGSVYKCNLRHITVAVKILKQVEVQKDNQFQRELEVLSRIHHPHLLLLIGACPDHGCLVYEYMENGSLDDRLCRKNGTPPISWFDRFRISWEIASALLFLHSSKPHPIVHRDLKPANILLDHNLVSKIGDVGLCTLIPSDDSTMATVYKNTALAGTYCYVDPEYQRTGLVSPKSDLYAYGIVVLQLLTGQPPMGLAHLVERAIEEGRLEEILDDSAGKWPLKEAKELAYLGLRCAEFRHKDRPDLKNEALPLLMRLKEITEREKRALSTANWPPSHFLCPILQDVMEDPWVAPDGYTYERRAIERWLSTHDTSPITNLRMPTKHLIPNRSLASAISKWKSKNYGDLFLHNEGVLLL